MKPIEYRFVLLGDGSVGKTSIFKRFQGQKFTDNIMSTVGTDKCLIHCNQLKVQYEDEELVKNFDILLFDTAGQERYRSITKNYFRGAQGIILLYDITNISSFEHIGIWLQSIKDSLSDWNRSSYMVMVLGNKLDKVENDENNREVLAEDAEKICSENNILWGGEFSAKNFNDNQIKEVLENFIKEIFIKLGNTTEEQKGKMIRKEVAKARNKKLRHGVFEFLCSKP